MNLFEDFMLVNNDALSKTMGSIKKHWMIIFTGIVYMIINAIMYTLVFTLFRGPLSLIAGIILAFFSAMMISNYLYLLHCVVLYDRLTIQDFKDGFLYFMWKIYSVFFVAWIASMLLNIVTASLGKMGGVFATIVQISVFVFLNALPETLYQKNMETLDGLAYSLDFARENIVNWFVPNLLMYGILYLVTGNVILNLFTTSLPFVGGSPIGIGMYLLGQLLFSFVMVYRGHLYKILSTSNPRKRMFMSKF